MRKEYIIAFVFIAEGRGFSLASRLRLGLGTASRAFGTCSGVLIITRAEQSAHLPSRKIKTPFTRRHFAEGRGFEPLRGFLPNRISSAAR